VADDGMIVGQDDSNRRADRFRRHEGDPPNPSFDALGRAGSGSGTTPVYQPKAETGANRRRERAGPLSAVMFAVH
jgi:hypothetical protein